MDVMRQWECPKHGWPGIYSYENAVMGTTNCGRCGEPMTQVEYVRADAYRGAVDRVAVLETAVRGLLGAGPSWPVPETREAILAAAKGQS